MYKVGHYTNEWGARFTCVMEGVHGQVKEPVITDEDCEDWSRVHFPEELLTIDVDRINAFCASTDQFVLSSDLVRPFEQIQFLRGTENVYLDIGSESPGFLTLLKKMHTFYCKLMDVWCSKTNVDGFFAMDDWGSQRALLISPADWKRIFKPLYRDYVDIAHSHGKKFFFHSDGYTLDIVPELIDLGFDAVNLQIFCIGPEKLRQFRGKITFWGELDRQHLLPYGSAADIAAAVSRVRENLWANGGAIAQCEFGAGAKPENVREMFRAWR
jgi:hypothetical protein